MSETNIGIPTTCGHLENGRRAVDGSVTVAALYCFAPFAEPAAIVREAARVGCASGIKGTLIIASEGINGTLAGSAGAIDEMTRFIRALPGCAHLDVKLSAAATMPFGRLKVRLKREIVTMGVDGIDPLRTVGTYLSADAWNALIADPATIVVDTRNDYEVAIGTFAGAIDPATTSFREFPDWAAAHLDPAERRPIAMFCTGGIRCEKATALLKQRGFTEVYHLEGGILRYLAEVPPERSLWQGACFVFDERVSVGHGLALGGHALCRTCGRPVDVSAHDGGGEGGGYLAEPCAACAG